MRMDESREVADVNHIQDVQCFIDTMCSTYNVSPINVVFYPKWCMEQHDDNAIGMAVYPNEYTGINQPREVWFVQSTLASLRRPTLRNMT